jgi:protein KRI1
MPKRKADTLSQSPPTNGVKKSKHDETTNTKKINLLQDSDSASSSDDESSGGAELEESGFKINEEYARRFEHNKKRAELHRCQSVIAVPFFFILFFIFY